MTDVGPLTGFTIAVTAQRRRLEFGAALEHRGARLVYAPTARIVPPAEDDLLLDATERCLATPVDVVVATTPIGLRGWLDAAQAWAVRTALLKQFRGAALVARGPKAASALKAAAATEVWSPPTESVSELIDHLLRSGVAGRRVVVQQHGEPLPDLVSALRHGGADVVEVTTFSWRLPEDPAEAHRLVGAVADSALDAVTFSSSAAAAGFLRAAEEQGRYEAVIEAVRSGVLAACIGPVTAAVLERAAVPVLVPGKSRLASLVRELADTLPQRRGQLVTAAGHRIDVRGHAVVVDGVAVAPGAPAMAVLSALAHHPGRILTGAELATALGDQQDESAVAEVVERLGLALADSRIVQTISGRAYRLAADAERGSGCGHDPGAG